MTDTDAIKDALSEDRLLSSVQIRNMLLPKRLAIGTVRMLANKLVAAGEIVAVGNSYRANFSLRNSVRICAGFKVQSSALSYKAKSPQL